MEKTTISNKEYKYYTEKESSLDFSDFWSILLPVPSTASKERKTFRGSVDQRWSYGETYWSKISWTISLYDKPLVNTVYLNDNVILDSVQGFSPQDGCYKWSFKCFM